MSRVPRPLCVGSAHSWQRNELFANFMSAEQLFAALRHLGAGGWACVLRGLRREYSRGNEANGRCHPVSTQPHVAPLPHALLVASAQFCAAVWRRAFCHGVCAFLCAAAANRMPIKVGAACPLA
eukprot:6212198-Pyramimonas_sp.AAC.1